MALDEHRSAAWLLRDVTHVPGVLRVTRGRLEFTSTRRVVFDAAPETLGLVASRTRRRRFHLTVDGERVGLSLVRPAGAVAVPAELWARAGGPGGATGTTGTTGAVGAPGASHAGDPDAVLAAIHSLRAGTPDGLPGAGRTPRAGASGRRTRQVGERTRRALAALVPRPGASRPAADGRGPGGMATA